MKRSVLILTVIVILPLAVGFGLGYLVMPSPHAKNGAQSGDVFMPAAQSVQERPSQEDLNSGRRNAITRAVAKVSPAVVGINVTEVREQRGPVWLQNDPFWSQFFGAQKYEVRSLGSGFIISPDGYIVTNDHVAGNATKITVTLVGGKRLDAQLVGTDPLTDIALLKVRGSDLPFVEIGNSDDIIIGEWAIAFGNPFGMFEINDKPTVTVGVISSTSMSLGQQESHVYRDMLETDAAINPGNSGGPLVNSEGNVIGVNTLIYTGGQSNAFVGYGFAIPINRVKRIVTELKKHGKVQRDYNLGFAAQPVDDRIAAYFGLASAQGIIVAELDPRGAAAKAGLKIGDIIVQANGGKINSEEELYAILGDSNGGNTLALQVIRERKLISLTLTLRR